MPDSIPFALRNKPVLSSDDPRAVAEYMLALSRWAGGAGRVTDVPSNTGG
jgi:hypothetical protein